MYRAIYVLLFDSSLRKHEFVSQIVLRKFVVNKVAPGHYALRVLRFSPVGVIPPILPTHFVLILLLSGRRVDETSETFYKAVFFSNIGEDLSEFTF
jgi:hypothetical protein